MFFRDSNISTSNNNTITTSSTSNTTIESTLKTDIPDDNDCYNLMRNTVLFQQSLLEESKSHSEQDLHKKRQLKSDILEILNDQIAMNDSIDTSSPPQPIFDDNDKKDILDSWDKSRSEVFSEAYKINGFRNPPSSEKPWIKPSTRNEIRNKYRSEFHELQNSYFLRALDAPREILDLMSTVREFTGSNLTYELKKECSRCNWNKRITYYCKTGACKNSVNLCDYCTRYAIGDCYSGISHRPKPTTFFDLTGCHCEAAFGQLDCKDKKTCCLCEIVSCSHCKNSVYIGDTQYVSISDEKKNYYCNSCHKSLFRTTNRYH